MTMAADAPADRERSDRESGDASTDNPAVASLLVVERHDRHTSRGPTRESATTLHVLTQTATTWAGGTQR